MELFNLVVVLLIAVQVWVAIKIFKKPKNLPPGPYPLPIIGNLLTLGKVPHKSLAELAKIYGPLMSLRLGSLTTIVVSSPFVAQQVLQKNDLVFSSRWVPEAVRATRHNDFSIAFLPASLPWRNLRKFCNSQDPYNSQLFSNRCLDGRQRHRQTKVEELISYVDGCCQAGAPVNISQAVFSSNLSLLSTTFFSMDLADPKLPISSEFREIFSQLVSVAGETNFADYFPVLKGLDLQRIRHRMEDNYVKILGFFQRLIDERLAKRITDQTTEEESSDVLDAFLKMNQHNEEGFGMSYIIHSLQDLFLAGTDTTSSTIEWAMAELLRDRTKLEKVRAELLAIIGRGSPLKEADITRLPYLQAVVKETLRLHPPVPFLVPRIASSNIDLCGFKVPKGSQVLINVWAIGRDPTVWERPSSFEPERFLGSEIDYKGQHFEFTPFGGGRRICPGLPLANRNLHMILGSLILSFDWKLEDGVEPEKLDMEEKSAMAVHKAKPLLAIPVSHG